MQAVFVSRYGGPEVFELRELAMPAPKANQVRIRVRASTVGPAGSAYRQGSPLMVRLINGLRKPRHAIPGAEFAGVIDACGDAVTAFKKGDRVCGISPDTMGAHAEYVCLPASGPIGLIPDGVSFDDAASLCDGATYALTFLRDSARVRPGQRVLINGASGAIGVAAVQLARHFGAEVTGVCSTANIELVKSLGAGKVIDYTREDFTQGSDLYDVVFDTVARRSFAECARVLAPAGQYLTTVPDIGILLQMLWTAITKGKRVRFVPAGLMQSRANLEYLCGLAAAGQLRPVIDRRYPLAKIAEAAAYVDTGRKRGTVVLQHG